MLERHLRKGYTMSRRDPIPDFDDQENNAATQKQHHRA